MSLFRGRDHDKASETEGQTEEVAAPVSQVAQIQKRMGNARLLQLRAIQRQGVNPEEFIREDLAAKAAAGKYDQLGVEKAAEEVAIPGGGTALPPGLQQHAESHLGVSMGDVQMVTNGDSATKPMQAMAFTTHDAGTPKVVLGSDVNLQTADGQFTLMHELAHVAQQKKGQSNDLQGLGGDSGQREALEQSADTAAAKMCQGNANHTCSDPSHGH